MTEPITVAEEFLLLAYDDAGSPVIGATALEYGLAGAVLQDLVLAGRIGLADKDVVVRDPTPTGEPVADEALLRITGDKPRQPSSWLGPLNRDGLRDRVVDGLVNRGILRCERDKVLWVFPRTRYPSTTGAEPAVETGTRARLRAAITSTDQPEPRTAALCALVKATGLSAKVFQGLPKEQARPRLEALVKSDWVAASVRSSIQAVQAALGTVTITGGS